MTDGLTIARSEFILGGQKSGKSRRAELLARDWLAQSTGNKAVLIATAQAWDEEMGERIARHQADRAQRVPGMSTLEEPLALAEAISLCSAPQTLVVVDCLTLWLTNLLMPASSIESADNRAKTASKEVAGRLVQAQQALLLSAIQKAAGPVVLVGNEVGLGVIPLGREVRAFVDALGCLNQEVANVCARVTLMAAGQSLVLKGSP